MSATRELQYIQRYRCWTHSDVDRERRAGRSAVCLQLQQGPISSGHARWDDDVRPQPRMV